MQTKAALLLECGWQGAGNLAGVLNSSLAAGGVLIPAGAFFGVHDFSPFQMLVFFAIVLGIEGHQGFFHKL